MALTEGTNQGFVTTTPSTDPAASNGLTMQRLTRCSRFQAPANGNVSEIGLFCSTVFSTSVEFGIYSDDSGEPGDLLESNTASKAAGEEWKTITGFNTDIVSGNWYWLAAVDRNGVPFGYSCDYTTPGTSRYEQSVSSLEDPWETGTDNTSNSFMGIYAKYTESGAAAGLQLQIGDAWKEYALMKINIGDDWKAVAGLQINIGDTWKTIF